MTFPVDLTVADTRIGSSEFGDYQYARFLEWAFFERQSKGAFIRNISVARTEVNEANGVISGQREYYCRAYGLSKDELLRRILEADSQGISIPELHRRLIEEAQENSNANLSLLPKQEPPQKTRGRKIQGKK